MDQELADQELAVAELELVEHIRAVQELELVYQAQVGPQKAEQAQKVDQELP